MTSEIERWSPLKVWVYSMFNRNPKSNRAVVDLLELSPEDRLLDIGCGPGAALELAAGTGAAVAGIDPSPSMVARASHRVPSAELKLGSAEQIPFADDAFTVVINIASFHHWADRDTGLREVFRVLAPGGRLHIVEGVLREGKDGHGLNPGDVQVVRARLEELGYVDVNLTEIRPGWRHRYYVIGASAQA